MSTLIFRTAVRVAAPLIFLFSIYLLWRGHQMPGGGFIAGLMTSTAIVLEYLAFGIRYVKKFERSLPYIFATGLLCAFGTGLTAVLLGAPFLRSDWGELHTRIFGQVELASAMMFDFGVFLVVVGTTMTILTLLGEEEVREA